MLSTAERELVSGLHIKINKIPHNRENIKVSSAIYS